MMIFTKKYNAEFSQIFWENFFGIFFDNYPFTRFLGKFWEKFFGFFFTITHYLDFYGNFGKNFL